MTKRLLMPALYNLRPQCRASTTRGIRLALKVRVRKGAWGANLRRAIEGRFAPLCRPRRSTKALAVCSDRHCQIYF